MFLKYLNEHEIQVHVIQAEKHTLVERLEFFLIKFAMFSCVNKKFDDLQDKFLLNLLNQNEKLQLIQADRK